MITAVTINTVLPNCSEHIILGHGPQALVASMQSELGIDPAEIYPALPEWPAVALYYTANCFHVFWYVGLSEQERARICKHLQAHQVLGDLRPVEGFCWFEVRECGTPILAHLDPTRDYDLEPRAIRWSLDKYLGDALSEALTRADALDELGQVAEQEDLDLALVCAWAGLRLPHPIWLVRTHEVHWSNRADSGDAPRPDEKVRQVGGDRYTLHHHKLNDLHLTVAQPAVTVEPRLTADDADPDENACDTFVVTTLLEANSTGPSLEQLFAESAKEQWEISPQMLLDSSVDFERRLTDMATTIDSNEDIPLPSLESLFVNLPVEFHSEQITSSLFDTSPAVPDLNDFEFEPDGPVLEMPGLRAYVTEFRRVEGEVIDSELFAGALWCARQLDWICAEPLEDLLAFLTPHLSRLQVRVIYCPPVEATLDSITATVPATLLRSGLTIKVGFGLPGDHSIALLSDASGDKLFLHQTHDMPTSLVDSWTSPYEQIRWRQERFELLWEDRLRPRIQMEALKQLA
ncbi:MAG: hypothetical protein H7Y22_09095 [Gemmatimonadaceae bacterium]|nr:hypothetical protein [Gloeobacterales cyanobacterium ES-bin-141]